MQKVEITITSKKETAFLLALLKKFNFIRSVRVEKKPIDRTLDMTTRLSEKSLAEEWNTAEDDRWDKIL